MPRSKSLPTAGRRPEDPALREGTQRQVWQAFVSSISKIEIERTRDEVKVVLFSARPGILIGRKGERVEELQKELQEKTGRRINIKIEEINRPEIVANSWRKTLSNSWRSGPGSAG